MVASASTMAISNEKIAWNYLKNEKIAIIWN